MATLKPVNLKSLFLKYGINSKTNFDIYDICKDLKLECFICMRDEIPEALGTIIFNYQTTNEYGSHWCCFSNNLYFDSFGIKPIRELEARTLKYNDTQIQPFETEICGILSIYFLYLVKSFEFEDMTKFKNITKFDNIIEIMKKEVNKVIT